MRVGIDASNLRQGGGITHLVQLLRAAEPASFGIERVVVWGDRPVLDALPDAPWLQRTRPAILDQAGLGRLWWQNRQLTRAAAKSVDVLFAPGGTYLGSFRPFVTMFRNMLPFDARERRRYAYSGMRAKLELLRVAQRATFRRASGLIFLNDYARDVVRRTGLVPRHEAVIPHGLDGRFFAPLKSQEPMAAYSPSRPYAWLYVSAIHEYKHPWNVAEAAALLRAAGWPVTLAIVGSPHPAAMRRLEQTIRRVDPRSGFIRLTRGVSHADLPEYYRRADAFVFASTCENMPNSLLEAMAAGLPIASSDRPPMPAILEGGGVTFDPESTRSIVDGMTRLMEDPDLRARVSTTAQATARQYSWTRCARDTFGFLRRVAGS